MSDVPRDPLILDRAAGVVQIDDRCADVSPRELRLVAFLRAHPAQLLSHARLQTVAGDLYPCDGDELDRVLATLRAKLLRVSRGRAQLRILDRGAILTFDDLPAKLSLGELELDREIDVLTLDSTELRLAPRRSALVATLISRAGTATSAELAIPGADEDEATIRALVHDTARVLRVAFENRVAVFYRVSSQAWFLAVPDAGQPLRVVEALELDPTRREARASGRVVRLAPASSSLLDVLMDCAAETLPPSALIEAVADQPPGLKSLQTRLGRLRAELAPLRAVEIQTVPGEGSRLLVAPRVSARLLIGNIGFDARTGFVWGPDGRIALTPRQGALFAMLVAYLRRVPPDRALHRCVGDDLPVTRFTRLVDDLRTRIETVAPGEIELSTASVREIRLEIAGADRWRFGDVTFVPAARTVRVRARQLRLHAVETGLFALALASSRRPVEREQYAIRAQEHGIHDPQTVQGILASLSRRLGTCGLALEPDEEQRIALGRVRAAARA